jgi:hypothetical protein
VSPYYIQAGDHTVQPAAYEEAPSSLLAKAAPSARMSSGPLLEPPAERKLPAAAVVGKLPTATVVGKLPAAVSGKLPAATLAGKLPSAVAAKLPAVAVAGKLPTAAVAGKLPATAVAGRKRRRSAVDRRRKRKLRKAAQLAAISWPTNWEVRTSLDFYVNVGILQCCGSGMFIPDPNFFPSWVQIFSTPDPGSAAKNLSILSQIMVSKFSEI